jgi:hypothetical protein
LAISKGQPSHPDFWHENTRYGRDENKFMNNALWQREFCKGMFSVVNRVDMDAMRFIILAGIKKAFELEVWNIEGLSEAERKGIEMGKTLLEAVKQAYAK